VTGLRGKQLRAEHVGFVLGPRINAAGRTDHAGTALELFLTTDADVIIRMKAMNFPSGSAIVPAQSYDLLELASKAVDLFGDRVVRVEGHTDSVGNDEYNQALSERRAVTVKEYLDARFAENNRTITSVGFGEARPIANNEKSEGRAQNRRIDIVLIAPPIPMQP